MHQNHGHRITIINFFVHETFCTLISVLKISVSQGKQKKEQKIIIPVHLPSVSLSWKDASKIRRTRGLKAQVGQAN